MMQVRTVLGGNWHRHLTLTKIGLGEYSDNAATISRVHNTALTRPPPSGAFYGEMDSEGSLWRV